MVENYAKILKTLAPLSQVHTPWTFQNSQNDGVFQKSIKIINIFYNRNLELYNCIIMWRLLYLMYNLKIKLEHADKYIRIFYYESADSTQSIDLTKC